MQAVCYRLYKLFHFAKFNISDLEVSPVAQCHILLAFRKRLAKRGYKDIHIKQARDDAGKVKNDIYVVSAVEPLSGSVVTTERSVIALNAMMR